MLQGRSYIHPAQWAFVFLKKALLWWHCTIISMNIWKFSMNVAKLIPEAHPHLYSFQLLLEICDSQIILTLAVFILFNFVNPTGENCLVVHYICTSLIMSDVEHLQIHVKCLYFFLCELPIPLFCPFLYWGVVFVLLTEWYQYIAYNIPCRYFPIVYFWLWVHLLNFSMAVEIRLK